VTPILARDAYRTRPSVWTLALVLALLVHVGVIVGVARLHLAEARALPASEAPPPPLEFVFAPSPEEPRQFTELPEDRADAPPEHPEQLSNVDSRARDLTTGGEDTARPHSEGRADFPQVAMDTGAQSTPPAPAGAPAPVSEAEESPRGVLPRQGTPAAEDPLADFRRYDPAKTLNPQPPSPRPGNADVRQEAMASPDGNVKLLGDVSLNTSAWVYGYWMQRFRRAVEAHWNAPYAFKIGMMQGWTLVGLEVSRTGELLKVEVLDEQGHWTLRDASVAAIQAAAPFEPLPPDAPEQTLRLQIRMIYTDYGR